MKLRVLMLTVALIILAAGLARSGSAGHAGFGAGAVDEKNTATMPVTYFPANQVAAGFAKGGPLFSPQGANFTVMTARRDASGAAEVHAKDTDIFYIAGGSATFVTGGTPVDAKNISPDEVRSASLNGGESRTISTGDVIVIPKGIPHWFKEVKPPFTYFVVKVR
jgi:mannose-6-phosphate isomerase-like protein (cupin superfamily)